jgi:hypothetical protein
MKKAILTAKSIPFSSVVGGGLLLKDEKERAVCQLVVIGNVCPPEGGRATAEDVMGIVEAVVRAINVHGLEVGA